MTRHRPRPRSRVLPAESRGLPVVAIVGRPNVGKSTLFNRLARQKLALVHDEPGVTRDRNYVETTAFGRDYTLVDTGGYDPEDEDPMKTGIARHVREAIAEADVLVFVSDAATELTSADRAAVDLLRRSDKPVFFAANKADGPRADADAFELYRLGVREVFPISALHGRGIAELEGAFVRALPSLAPAEDAEDDGTLRVALVGRPNAGKSSTMNRILGEDRMLVDARPGTTRDAIDVLVERGGRRYVFIDTAGLRKKGKVTKADDAVEGLSVSLAVKAIERAHVVVLLCDADEGVAEQDAKILGLAEDRGRALVVALNKSDLLGAGELGKAEERARDKLTFAPYAPVVRMSAKTGRGLNELFETIERVGEAYKKRVGTGELNRFFESVLATRTPPTQGGRAPRLYFITQAETAPPVFVVLASHPDSVHFSYQRFVTNQLRKHFGFEGVPVKVHYRERRRGRKGEPPPGQPGYVGGVGGRPAAIEIDLANEPDPGDDEG